MTRAGDGSRRFVLASASRSRLTILRTAGFDPEVLVTGIDESHVDATDTRGIVAELAGRKARAASARVENGLVLGCDSLLDVDGVPFGKPRTTEVARERWRAMRGRSGTLCTGHCLIDTAREAEAEGVAATVVHFGVPTDEELDAYIATGEPMRVAGAFTLEGRSAPFIDGVDGDPSNVAGLSMPLLRTMLGHLGVGITDLWS